MGFFEHLIVVAHGRLGGVCLLWKSTLLVEILEFNSYTVVVNIRDNFFSWSLVGFYGPTYYHRRQKAWTNLCALLESFDGPWLCFGDFNSILDANEKEGGRSGSSSASRYLSELMFDLGAVDLGFAGGERVVLEKD